MAALSRTGGVHRTMKAQDYQRRQENIKGWDISVVSFRLGDRYHCTIDDLTSGARIAQSEASARLEAEQNAIERASARLKWRVASGPAMTTPAAHAGMRLGPYEVVALIGAGGMGEVYRGTDPRLRRDVAIKILPTIFSNDPDRMHRFAQEACAAAALNHPNILAVYDAGAHEGVPYIVSELLEGETLRNRLEDSALPIRKTFDYAVQIANGLAAAHQKGIVHRDLKPENIFITTDGRVKILDFGLAKLVDAHRTLQDMSAVATAAATQPGSVLGSYPYMAPEQIRGLPADNRADIFAFGSILYEMIFRTRAFREETAVETMTAILKEEPPELARSGTIALGLELFVRRCLEKSPELRFQSAADLAFTLEILASVSADRTAASRKKRGRRP